MSELLELKAASDELSQAFVTFREENDKRLVEIEKHGQASVETNAKVDRIGATVAALDTKIKQLNVAMNRPAIGNSAVAQPEMKDANDFGKLLNARLQVRGQLPVAWGVDEHRLYKAALEKFIRRQGDTGMLDEVERKALSVGSEPDGGYWVTPDMSGRIVQRIFETSPIRVIASAQTISTDALEGIRDIDQATQGWVAETAARAATNTPQIGKWRIAVHEQYAFPQATQQLLDDGAVNVEQWLSDKVSDKFARTENTAFVLGSGNGQPRGFASYPTAATADATRGWGTMEHVATGTAASLGVGTAASDKVIDLVFKMNANYRRNATWVMARSTLAEVRKMKDGQGAYLWERDYSQRQGGLLLGYTVTEAEDVATIGTNSLSIAFGNFQMGYQIVDRAGISVLRDPYTNKPYVGLYARKRVGGDVVHFDCVKFLKFGTA